MSRSVQCVLLKREAPGLDYLPYPGDLGKRIYANVSKEGWEKWRSHQIMLINEYRLTPVEPKARKFLESEMEKYFFGGGSEAPKEFVGADDSWATRRFRTRFVFSLTVRLPDFCDRHQFAVQIFLKSF